MDVAKGVWFEITPLNARDVKVSGDILESFHGKRAPRFHEDAQFGNPTQAFSDELRV